MSLDYAPGTVAEVTYLDKRCRAMRTGTPKHMGWEVVRGDGTKTWCSDTSCYVTDVRPLVVLDLDSPPAVVSALRAALPFEDRDFDSEDQRVAALADQIEAQTKPPRIPEPGLWGVVEASCDVFTNRVKWIHGDPTEFGNDWHTLGSADESYHRVWTDLIDPTLIRDGVES